MEFVRRRPGVGYLKSANFLKVILNHIALGIHVEGDGRPFWCTEGGKRQRESIKMAHMGGACHQGFREEQLMQVVL